MKRSAVYEKGDRLRLRVFDLSDTGAGVAVPLEASDERGMVFFVKGALPGDIVDATVMKMKKSYGFAHLDDIVTGSADRVAPVCPVSGPCGGCQLQMMSYEAELRWKSARVRDALVHIGGYLETDVEIKPIQGFENFLHYRNKAQFPVAKNKEGRAVVGFYAARTHSVIPVDSCAICFPEAALAAHIILEHVERYNIPIYDERTGEGTVRHILMRRGCHSAQIMVCIVVNNKGDLPRADKLADRLFSELPEMTSFSLSPNTARSNVVMGDKVITLRGKPYITDSMNGLNFRISPLSFYQVNTPQAERMYDEALELAQLKGDETVVDLYCGIGTISLLAAKRAGRVIGVETVHEAVICAMENAELNDISNVEFIEGRAEDELTRIASMTNGADVLIVDPPRAGLAASCVEAMSTLAPRKIIYISCNPSTLARDLSLFRDHGYSLSSARPYDMFPRTCHVETVVLLDREHVDRDYIYLDYEPKDDEYLNLMKKTATYRQVQEWVSENYPFKVTNLYIAQVKDKLGLEKRENFNKGNGKSRVAQVPKEKEEAIREAFKHFGVI